MSLARESAAKWLKLDAVCDQFEADCAGGNVPKIESYLASIPPNEQADAIRELLKIELHYRRQSGISVDAVEFKTRFPDVESRWLREQLNPAARSSAALRDTLNRRSNDRIQDPGEWPMLPGFEILEVLGRGGMGIVYKARQIDLGRLVALKMIRAGEMASPETISRFRAESRTLAQLQHPNLVQVFEVGEHQGRLFLAFEFVEGGSLDQCLNGVPQLAKPTAKLIQRLARATQYAHTRSIVHRDLKPANILLEARPKSNRGWDSAEIPTPRPMESTSAFGGSAIDRDRNPVSVESRNQSTPSSAIVDFGEPKIADFGLAKHLEQDSSQTRSGMIIGSPCYMSPEQAAGDPDRVGAAADVYSLGAILYEALTGRPPFRAPTVNETLRQLQDLDPVSPRLIQPTVPRDLETICLKCLSKEVERRYESAGALADDLDRFLRGEPVLARPVTHAERTWRWCVRHPLVSVLASILFLVMVAGTPTLVWKWNEANQQRLRAESNADQFRTERDTAKALRDRAEANQKKAEENEELTRQNLYLRRIGQAYGEWQSNLVGRAAERLDECPEDLRGWEWYHLKNLCRSEYLILRGHQSEVGSLKYSNDGRTIISGSGVMGGILDGEAIVWDARTGRSRHVLRGHIGSIHDIAMSADSSKFVTASAGNVKIWNDQGQEIATLADPGNGAFAVAISADGKLLATGGFHPPIHLWNAETGAFIKTLNGHHSNVFALALSPDGHTLYSASYDATVRIWNVDTGEQTYPPFIGPGSIYSLAISPDGRYLVYAHHNTVFVTDLAAEPLQPVPFLCACDTITCLNFSPEGRRLALSSIDGNVLLIDLKTGHELRRLHTHDGSVKAVAVGDGGRGIATAGLDRLVKIWNASTDGPADQIHLSSTAKRGLFLRMAITSDGNRLLLPSAVNRAAYDSGLNDLLVIDPNEREINHPSSLRLLKGHTKWLTDVAVTAGGEWYASSSADGTIRIWNAKTNEVEKVLEGHKGVVTCVEFSHNGQWLATGGEDGTVRLWDRISGEQRFLMEGHTGQVNNVAFNDDGRILASAGDDGRICIWKAGQRSIAVPGHEGAVTSVAFSHNGAMLASSGRDRTVRVWDGRTTLPIHVLHGHAADVLDVAFSLDDRRLGSASADHTVKLWDPVLGDEAYTLRSSRPMLTLAFHPDGKRLLATHFSSIESFSTVRMNSDAQEEHNRSVANFKWHRDQCRDAIRTRLLSAARFHLNSAENLFPEDEAIWFLRGELAVETNDWQMALKAYEEAESHSRGNVEAITGSALAGLHLGHLEIYRDACNRLMAQLTEDSSAMTLNNNVWNCCLAANCGVPPQLLVDKARRAVHLATRTADRANFLNTLATAQYRAGEIEESHISLEEALKLRDSIVEIEDWILMSMVESRLDHPDRAREWLTNAQQWLATAPARETTRIDWPIREARTLLLREAESLLREVSTGRRTQENRHE